MLTLLLVEIVLYTGQRMQAGIVESVFEATEIRNSYLRRVMVEEAYVINCKTGEVTGFARTPAASWRRDDTFELAMVDAGDE